ncbi:M1 family metallopeptidase [Sphingomonas sp. 28-62-11]|uniref:M1 family metallopeptidase n=1 Tax=Sphingomonas sp. 28-62-11 TaxID=1970432 RepID=UPI000BC3F9C7|nr:MAG: peptidase M1 [Sphingomonas sp. 28-62-11]
MQSPAAPDRDANWFLYGAWRRRINRLAAGFAFLALTGAAPPKKGEPPLTEQTQKSGGMIDADQAKLHFDSADLAIEILPEREAIAATAILAFTAKEPIDRLVIDLDRNLPVTAIDIDGHALPATAWTNPLGQLVIRLPETIAAKHQVKARIRYGGTPHVAVRAPWDDGFVWSRTRDGKPWVASTAEGYGCDLFWPCLDFPTGEPTQVTLHITVPKGLSAPSNGVLLGTDKHADGRTTWNWRIKRPNTYAIAITVGPYEQVSGTYKSRFGNSIPMSYWYLPGEKQQAEALFAEFAPTLDFFESVIGPYPFADEKVGVVETPHLGMEHQTINAYGNGYAKSIDGFDWLFHHEFAHEWFGNQVTAANWDDYWLHEGFGSYMQPLYGQWREGDARYATMLDAQRGKIENRAPLISGKIRTEEDVYEQAKGGPASDIYYKGSWTLHTLRWLIGDAAFLEATRRLVYGRTDPRPGNFTPRFGSSAEFQAIVNQVTGKDYGWFFDVYLRQAALPDLVSNQAGGMLSLEWKVPGGKAFPMPVEVRMGDTLVRVDMAGGRGTLALPTGAHVVIDPMARLLRRSTAVEALQAYRRGPSAN